MGWQDNIEIFEDTQRLYKSNERLISAIKHSIAEQESFMENVKITNFFFLDNRDSMDLHFREGDWRAILSAIRRKEAASDGITKKYGRKICQCSV